MDASHLIGIYLKKMLDILGEVRTLRLVHLATYTQGKGFSDEKGYIHNGRYELDNNLLSHVSRGLQADLRRFERQFKEG